ncbi:MAG: helix-turn-helix transcriptional regulator [Muribaculaceae bacterium]|nr:helix-turn-helix transcriptional regulator [Muribaculaceae bacterium]
MEDFPVASRIKEVIEALNLSDSQFADRCGISRPTLSLLLSGKNKKISDVMLSQIHNAFPEVSILWILFGEGEMFKKENNGGEEEGNGNENQIFAARNTGDDEQLNLVNVKQLEDIIQSVVNKSFESSNSNMEKLILKISQPLNLRKASKITVYYDDSTFETFVPER